MKIKTILFCAAMNLAVSATVNAESWSGSGEAGLIKSSGNSESENFNVGLNFTKQGDLWAHEFNFFLYKASADDVDSAESIGGAYRLKRALSDRRYVFGALSYLDDEFDGFTEQASISAGYGYKVIDTDPVGWDLGIGAGYRDTSELIRPEVDGPQFEEFEGDDLSGPTLVLFSDYRNQLTPTTQFVDKFIAEIGSDNTYIENDAAIIVAMNQKFALKAGLLVRHNTDPAIGADETDTITSINLVYNFK